MVGSGPITNTRTMEGSLASAIKRLRRFEQTPRVCKMIAQAQHYSIIVSRWENEAPTPDEEYTIIPEVLLLLKEAITYEQPAAAAAASDEPELIVDGAAGSELNAEPASGSAPSVEPELSLELDLEPPIDPKPSAQPAAGLAPDGEPESGLRMTLPGPGSAIGRMRVKTAGFGESAARMPAPAGAPRDLPSVDVGGGVSVLHPDRASWRPAPGYSGVTVKVLNQGPGEARCRALLRLEPGVELPIHQHGVAGDIYVLSGMLQLGPTEVHAGEIIRIEAGSTTAPLQCVSECTLLLVGGDRDEPIGAA